MVSSAITCTPVHYKKTQMFTEAECVHEEPISHHFSVGAILILTKHGVQWLLLHAKEIFPDVTKAEILDKSKASTLVKTLTCLQAFWFCLQCIVRLTMNTSISLLELNVFGHCTCTFIIYAIWWNKPLDVSEPTRLKVEDGPELEGLLAVLCSYTSRTVPSLPDPVAQCAVSGHSYSIWTDPVETGQTTNLPPEMPLWYAYQILYQSQNGSYQRQIPAHDLETLFSANGAAVQSEKFGNWRGLGFNADDNEGRVDECAGLHVEQLKRLFNLDVSLPQMYVDEFYDNMHADHICSKVSMYEDISRSKVRLTVGAEQIGLTYYLSRAKLEQLSLENEKSEQLENMLLISGEPKKTSKGSYHLERSFLLWLDLEGRDLKFLKVYPWAKKSPRPFLDRIHDWTFRLNPEDSVKHHVRFLHLDDLANRVEDLFTDWVVERVPECFAMSAEAFVYGGLHLLAWNAPFHAPIYGLLWKISGITITSLAIFPILIMLFLLCNAYTLGLESKLHKYLGLTLAVFTLLGMLSFMLLYIFARVYLVVKSFLSLAYLPESVLVTPNFSLYFPHIG